jgi:hypothetical protein
MITPFFKFSFLIKSKMYKNILSQPYPLIGNRWKIIFSISLFVALFMVIFQPFGLSEITGNIKYYFLVGYGLVTMIVLMIDLFFVTWLFGGWFMSEKWTVGKQIIWLIWILFSVGVANYFYTTIKYVSWNWNVFALLQLYTFAIGIFPIFIVTFLNYSYSLKQHLSEAQQISRNLNQPVTDVNQTVCLSGDNKKDELTLDAHLLILVESTGNYAEIYYESNQKINKSLLRCTIKKIHEQLHDHPQFFRCHRAYIVNLSRISEVKGNSQGLKLKMSLVEQDIPVARQSVPELKKLLG